ncbi:hypothetical protein PR048_004605 [Dryococelus australis]|uniref:HTH psq-type domain-containing protein n=1 Tax=Dryococelus australis TaxID=614101 RepID=A0ABQ9I5W0_9NEOP|nr:hypothetical protein PR048_004605 [Dryococelus australis]
MSQAIEKVRLKEMTIREAASNYNIPRCTLAKRKRRNTLGGLLAHSATKKNNKKTDHILLMELRFIGLSGMDVRKLAFDFAEVKESQRDPSSIQQGKGNDVKISGCTIFCRDTKTFHYELWKQLSFARASSYNKPAVDKFFKMLEVAYMRYGIFGDRLYNVDESSIKTVQDLGNVLGTKGKKQIYGLTSTESGRNATIICAMSAECHFISPAFIFPRKRRNEEMYNGAPPEP